MKLLTVRRVSYAKDNTPIELREYRITGVDIARTCVGTIKDWKEFAKQHKYNEVRIIEKDGKIREEIIK